MKHTRKYFDGIPQWILDMSLEEIEQAIAEEEKKLKAMREKDKKY